jgi:putative glycosyltransferase
VQLSIVTTLYRSASHLEEFHARISRTASRLTADYEIIFVNDGSPDRSLEIARDLLARDERIRIIDLSRNFGHHRAMMTGLARARGELVFLIDSDLEEEPELLERFVDAMRSSQADSVYGVQPARRGGPLERVSGWIFFKLFNRLSDVRIPENLVTVRLMTRRYVEALVEHRERTTMIAGLWALVGFHQVPLEVAKHSRSRSSYSIRRKLTLLANSITSFSDRPLVFIFYLGLAIFVASSLSAAYLIVRRLFLGVMAPGWASLIVSVWLLGGLTLFCIGVIGIYLSRVFIETKQRPFTIVRRVYERTQPEPSHSDSRSRSSVLL